MYYKYKIFKECLRFLRYYIIPTIFLRCNQNANLTHKSAHFFNDAPACKVSNVTELCIALAVCTVGKTCLTGHA